MPLMPTVCAMFTYKALRPVSGWVRTTGCSDTYYLDAASRPSVRMRSSRVFDTSACAELLMLNRPSSNPRKRSEENKSELQSLMRTSYAIYCLQKKRKQNIEQKH